MTGPRMFRRGMNLFPAYRGTGGRITYISPDWSRWEVKLPLNWRTRNYVGTTFGGSLYGAIDPIYMLMLIKMLGPHYIVWDKAASIQFKRPGKNTLYATFEIPIEVLQEIRGDVEAKGKLERTFTVDLVDGDGVVHARAEKLLYVRKKETGP